MVGGSVEEATGWGGVVIVPGSSIIDAAESYLTF